MRRQGELENANFQEFSACRTRHTFDAGGVRPLRYLLILGSIMPACAKPGPGRVKIADETLLQARDKGIDYAQKLDRAIDGSPAKLVEFILVARQLDTAGAYFHYFHIYEVAEIAGDRKFALAVQSLEMADLTTLVYGLKEAAGWLKRKRQFGEAFPETTRLLRKTGQPIDF